MAPSVPPRLARWSRRLLPAVAGLLVAGFGLQAFQAGQVTLAGSSTWESHVAVGHGLSALAAATVVLAYAGGHGPRVRRLAWSTLLAYYATVGLAVLRVTDGLEAVSALHPVGALAAFLAAALLALASADLDLLDAGEPRGSGRA